MASKLRAPRMVLAVMALFALMLLAIAAHTMKKENVTHQLDNPCGGRLLTDEELRTLFRDTAVKGGLGSYRAYLSDGSGYEHIDRNQTHPFRFVIKDQQICDVLNNGTVAACHSYAIRNGKVFDIVAYNPPFPSPGGATGLSVCVQEHFFRPEGHSVAIGLRPSRS